jgi:hypothetical protein
MHINIYTQYIYIYLFILCIYKYICVCEDMYICSYLHMNKKHLDPNSCNFQQANHRCDCQTWRENQIQLDWDRDC